MKGIHGYYFILPIITFSLWITDIVGLLGLWSADGFPRYQSTEANIVFISDVGAAHHTFFIIFSCLSAVFYMITVLLERHLRHQRRIPGSTTKQQTNLDIASVVFAVIGALGLIFLSIFDAFDYPNVHWSMTAVFIVGVAISVLLQTAQIFLLAKNHDDALWHLRAMAIVKTIILCVAVIALIVFVGLYADCKGESRNSGKCDKIVSGAGVCEWILSFLLSFFFLTYVVDFWPAKKRADKGLTEDGTMVHDPALAEKAGEGHRPTAPYAVARDMGPNHDDTAYNTMTTNTEAPSLSNYHMKEVDPKVV